MEPAELLASTVDKSQMPPLHQKRIVAFVNHFLINSCSFLNEFATKCEAKFIELERKMQRVEVALAIIESKLASIPEENSAPNKTTSTIEKPNETDQTEKETPIETEAPTTEALTTTKPTVRACEDIRYKKYFKLVKVGIPVDAVKQKMKVEGISDLSIIDTPNLELPDGIRAEETEM